MFAIKKILAVLFVIKIQEVVAQSTNIVQTKYEKISVDASSFTSIKTTSLGAQRYGKFLKIIK